MIRAASVHPFVLHFKRPVPTAAGTLAARHGTILRLEDHEGNVGLGEASPWNPAHRNEATLALQQTCAWLPGNACDQRRPPISPFALTTEAAFAYESAWLDLQARQAGKPLYQFLRAGSPSTIAVNALFDSSAPAAIEREAFALRPSGYRAAKLKLRRAKIEDDVIAATALRSVLQIPLRGDANGAWPLDNALKYITLFSSMGMEYLEQPSLGTMAELAALRKHSPLPLAVDEPLVSTEAVAACLAAEAADRLIFKPARLGGLAALEQSLEQADTANIPVTMTSMFEGPIGMTVLLHLAAAWLPANTVHGLATSRHLAGADAYMPPFQDGRYHLAHEPGLGAPATAFCNQFSGTVDT